MKLAIDSSLLPNFHHLVSTPLDNAVFADTEITLIGHYERVFNRPSDYDGLSHVGRDNNGKTPLYLLLWSIC